MKKLTAPPTDLAHPEVGPVPIDKPELGNNYWKHSRYEPYKMVVSHLVKANELVKLRSHGVRSIRVLDIACGDGLFVHLARKAGIDAWGCDLAVNGHSNEIFERDFGEKLIFQLDLNDLKEHQEKYDFVVCGHLAHVMTNTALQHLIALFSRVAGSAWLHIDAGAVELGVLHHYHGQFPLLEGWAQQSSDFLIVDRFMFTVPKAGSSQAMILIQFFGECILGVEKENKRFVRPLYSDGRHRMKIDLI